MFSEHSTHSNYINVPYRLAKRYRKDKPMWDLLCFAVCLKMQRNDSGMYLRDPKEVMKMFHCSYRKAVRLMTQATADTRLFRYNPKTKFITARSFEIGCDVKNSRHGNKFRMDDVIVIEKGVDGRISHYDISSQLRDRLIQKMLRTQVSSDELQSQNTHHSERRKPLTQKYIGNVAGCHQTTVSRRIRKMEKAEIISVKRHDKIEVYDLVHEVVINDIPNRRPFVSGRSLYIRDVNDYSILDESIHFAFKHIVYNHSGRMRDNKTKTMPYEL